MKKVSFLRVFCVSKNLTYCREQYKFATYFSTHLKIRNKNINNAYETKTTACVAVFTVNNDGTD